MAKVSTSAFEARNLGFISSGDDITMNRERVLTDAKERSLEMVHEGYRAPVRGPTFSRPVKAFWRR